MDSITMKGLYFYGYHGALEEERTLGQEFVVDLELFCSLKKPGLSDDLRDSINYAAVYSVVKECVEKERYNLVEALAERIADRILKEFEGIREIDIGVKKPGAPLAGNFDYVGVKLRRPSDE